MKYHFTAIEQVEKMSPKDLGLKYTSVQRIEIDSSLTIYSNHEELCLFCIDGKAEFKHKEKSGEISYKDMIYLPPNSNLILIPKEKVTIIKFGAPTNLNTKFVFIKFNDINQDPKRNNVYGKKENSTKRNVWNYIDEKFYSGRFLVGICEGSNGGWTAWPPHEHGDIREEVYVYFNMGNNFGIQCIYEDINNPLEVAIIRDGDLITIPKGYHPNVGCPSGNISYIYCMVSRQQGDRNFMDLNIQKDYGDKFE